MSEKIKKDNKIKKYGISFVIVVLLMIIFLLMEKSIPNERSRRNILKSENYYHEYFGYQHSKLNIIINKHETIDAVADIYHLGMIYLEDNKHPWKEFIEMNKDSEGTQKLVNKKSFRDFKIDSDYSRYWNGQLIILKLLLSFFTMPTIYNVYLMVFTIIFLTLLYELYKYSKRLVILLTLSAIATNLFFVTTCDNLMYVFIISMLAAIFVIKFYGSNNKNMDLLFFIVGMLSVYFDHITCETITLTLPLFIYICLNMRDKKSINSKKMLLLILLWLSGYFLTFAVKWILLIIHYHGGIMEKVINPMLIRVYYENENIVSIFFDTMKNLPNYFYPFNYYGLKILLLIVSVLSFIYLIYKDKINRVYYLWLLFISCVPIIRYFVLSSHSNYHNFFTYRAYLPLVLLCLLSISLVINNIIEMIKR